MEFTNRLLKRTSVRSYTNQPIEPAKIQTIIDVINASPTSKNSHDFSAIIIDDLAVRKELALGLITQSHIYQAPLFIAFCADYNRINQVFVKNNKTPDIHNVNQFLTGAGDAFIAATFAHAAALDMGLSCCYIGFLRHSYQLLQKALHLDGYIVPVVGLTIGYASKENQVRPKTNHVYHHHYDAQVLASEIANYDTTMSNYYEQRVGAHRFASWSDAVLFNHSKDVAAISEHINKVFKLTEVKK